MLTVLDHQLATLAWAVQRSVHRDLVRRLRRDHPEHASRATWIIDGVMADAEALEIEGVELIYRMARLATLPGYPDIPGRWGALVPRVLGNKMATAEARLDFVETEIVPRILEELAAMADEDES